jgi:hypothetical protein
MYHASSAEADFVVAISGSELLFSFNLFVNANKADIAIIAKIIRIDFFI